MKAFVAIISIVESIWAAVVETVKVSPEIEAVIPEGLLPIVYRVDTVVLEVSSNGDGVVVGLGLAAGICDA
jgi:hypothetical protein